MKQSNRGMQYFMGKLFLFKYMLYIPVNNFSAFFFFFFFFDSLRPTNNLSAM